MNLSLGSILLYISSFVIVLKSPKASSSLYQSVCLWCLHIRYF